MTDALKAFLQASSLEHAAFAPTSRYYGLATARWTRPDGLEVMYVRRRFIPAPDGFATVREHVVSEGDRLDNLAAKYLGDPEQYWRLCDGSGAMRPDELTETVGARLRITLPAGIPGGPDA
jgi:hypothetical protein